MSFLKAILTNTLEQLNTEIKNPSASQSTEKQHLPDKPHPLSIGPMKKATLHPDLNGLIWFSDGPYKNYSPSEDKRILAKHELFTIFFTLGGEPSAISMKLPVSEPGNEEQVERPPYYPNYSSLTPEQRWNYLQFLTNPYKAVDIGYVFILYYGLERHLFIGDFDKAYNVILKLRQINNNESFQYYSSKALVLSCILRKSFKVIEFLNTLNDESITSLDVNLFLLCLYSFNVPLTAKKLVLLAKSFNFVNKRYIKAQPDIFLEQLTLYLKRQFGQQYIRLNEYIDNINQLGKVSIPAFANMAIIEKHVEVPDFTSHSGLSEACYTALAQAHEATKRILRQNRKKPNAIIKG